LEFKAGFELYDIMEEQVNRPSVGYKLTPFEDRWWNCCDYDDDQECFTNNIFSYLEIRLEFCANCLGTNLTDAPLREGYGVCTKWNTGIVHVDERVAVSCFNWFLGVLKTEIQEHTCKAMEYEVPTKIDWWTRTFPNEDYEGTVCALKDLVGTVEGNVLKKVLKGFKFE
jgi:hypothetical protein